MNNLIRSNFQTDFIRVERTKRYIVSLTYMIFAVDGRRGTRQTITLDFTYKVGKQIIEVELREKNLGQVQEPLSTRQGKPIDNVNIKFNCGVTTIQDLERALNKIISDVRTYIMQRVQDGLSVIKADDIQYAIANYVGGMIPYLESKLDGTYLLSSEDDGEFELKIGVIRQTEYAIKYTKQGNSAIVKKGSNQRYVAETYVDMFNFIK